MKKFLVALFTVTLVFAPISDVIFLDQDTTVEAKRYKSGKKSFNPGNSGTNSNNNSLFQNNQRDTTKNSQYQNSKKDSTNNQSTVNKNNSKTSDRGGLLKGLALGGLAGLLFGGLLANLGMLGSILGLFINVLAIIVLIGIAVKIYSFFKRKKKEQEEANVWRN